MTDIYKNSWRKSEWSEGWVKNFSDSPHPRVDTLASIKKALDDTNFKYKIGFDEFYLKSSNAGYGALLRSKIVGYYVQYNSGSTPRVILWYELKWHGSGHSTMYEEVEALNKHIDKKLWMNWATFKDE